MTAPARMSWRGIDEPTLAHIATQLAAPVRGGGVIHLAGELGAGKTTFARALLAALGIGVRIKSPTYSLIESYAAHGLAIHHLDLYRIAEPGELEWLGLADLAVGPHLLLIEWPERARGALPNADLMVELVHAGAVRDLALQALTPAGRAWIAGASAWAPQPEAGAKA